MKNKLSDKDKKNEKKMCKTTGEQIGFIMNKIFNQDNKLKN